MPQSLHRSDAKHRWLGYAWAWGAGVIGGGGGCGGTGVGGARGARDLVGPGLVSADCARAWGVGVEGWEGGALALSSLGPRSQCSKKKLMDFVNLCQCSKSMQIH